MRATRARDEQSRTHTEPTPEQLEDGLRGHAEAKLPQTPGGHGGLPQGVHRGLVVGVCREDLLHVGHVDEVGQAACLPGAWLTAYRMLFEKSGAQPGSTVLVQGASGGVGTALVSLGQASGYRVWAVSRDAEKRRRLKDLGAEVVVAPGERLPHKVDAVLDTVGEATWLYSLKALRRGGRLVISGATSGDSPPADLGRIFANQLSVVGSTMGTAAQLAEPAAFCVRTGVRPTIDRVLPLAEAGRGFVPTPCGGRGTPPRGQGPMACEVAEGQAAVRLR